MNLVRVHLAQGNISLCFSTTRVELTSIYQENPVDMMMKLMEKYSKHLESIVAERTHELVEEKKKTDRLLYGVHSENMLFCVTIFNTIPWATSTTLKAHITAQ